MDSRACVLLLLVLLAGGSQAAPSLPASADAARVEDPSAVACDACEFGLSLLPFAVKKAGGLPSIDSVQEALLELCAPLSDDDKVACEALTVFVAENLHEWLNGTLTATEACEAMRLCHSTAKADVRSVRPHTYFERALNPPSTAVHTTAAVQVQADLPCVLCEFVLKELSSHLPANFTEAQLEQELDNVCKKLPATIDPECEALVTLFGDKIYKAITGGTPPDQVCSAIKLCHNSTTALTAPTPGPVCQVCLLVVGYIPFALAMSGIPTGLGDVFAALFAVCASLPKEYQAICDVAAALVARPLSLYLSGQVTNEQICQKIHLCPPNGTSIVGN